MSLRRSGPVDEGACQGDTNGDLLVNVDDLLNVLIAWGPCTNCPEDIDMNGTVNIDDLLIIIAAWGVCR